MAAGEEGMETQLSDIEKLVQAIAVTAELTGTRLSEAAAVTLAEDLAEFEPGKVMAALRRCRREGCKRLTVGEVIARIDDGRPGPEEAWAMIPKDEFSSVVWTDEMSIAMQHARSLLDEGEMVQARMAFRERYVQLVADARDARVAPNWTPSLGHDPAGREAALMNAVANGRISVGYASEMCPAIADRRIPQHLLEGQGKVLETIGQLIEAKRLGAPS